jgi:diguanylate cyclase (GGDEF)-like protein
LQEIVARLIDVVREEDLVARFGGDEFAILAGNVTDGMDAGTLAERIAETLAQPFVIDGHKISITSSIGIMSPALRRCWSRRILRFMGPRTRAAATGSIVRISTGRCTSASG